MGLKASATCELTFGAKPPGGRHPGRRRARRHRADVPDDRVRPDDGRHEGHLHAVHRLPERARLRQAAACRAPTSPEMTDKAAPRVTITPPPRCPPDADAAEGLRRGHAGAGPLHAPDPGQVRAHGGRGTQDDRPSALNDLLLPVVKGVRLGEAPTSCCPRPADPGRLRVTCRTTRSSSTSGTRRSTPCTRARPRSRAWTSSSARSSGTTGRRSTKLLTAIVDFTEGARQRRPDGRAGAARPRRLADVQAMLGAMVGLPDQRRRRPAPSLQGRAQHDPAADGLGDLVIGWLLLRQAEVALTALDAQRLGRRGPRLLPGKVAAAKWFAANVLPELAVERTDRRGDHRLELMALPEDAF